MTDKHIPTMPQSEHIPTMPQSEHIPTMPQDSDGARTKTVPQNQGGVNNLGASKAQGRKSVICSDIQFVGERGGEFTVYANEKVSDDSGESQIYFCNMQGSSEKYVARILISVRPDSPMNKIATRNKVISFLATKSRDKNSHILPLIDYATVRLAEGEYYIEVYPFCEGGDLSSKKGSIPYSELRDKIIPSLNTALKTFHEAGFVHRDVKPDNLYYYKGELVIGDFGITCDLRDDGFATDKTKTGTLGYYAPELMSQAALIASDYYSFGQTIWTLYSGEMMYQSIVRVYKSKGIDELRNKINKAMLDNEYFGLDEIKPEEKFFEILIRGLLQYDPSNRFGYDEVSRWLSGDKSVAHNIPKYESQAIYRNPFKYDGKDYWDNDEVFEVLAANWAYAKQGLYSGTLKNFYATVDFSLSGKIDEIVKKYSRSNDRFHSELWHDIGLSMFLLELSDYKKFAWQGIMFGGLSSLSHAIESWVLKQVDVTRQVRASYFDLFKTGLMQHWYETLQKKSSLEVDKGVLNALNEIQNNTNEHLCTFNKYRFPQNSDAKVWSNEYSIYLTYFLFAKDENCIKVDGCADFEEIVKKAISYKKSSILYLERLICSPVFCAFLYRHGYGEHLHNIIESSADRHERIEFLIDFMMARINDESLKKEFIECYLNYGPDSHLLWVQKNIDLYCFNGKDAKAVQKEITSITIDGENIDSIRQSNNSLKLAVDKLRSMFVDNVFLAMSGLLGNRTAEGVTSKHLKAYWHADYFDRPVPVGFIYYILKKGEDINE